MKNTALEMQKDWDHAWSRRGLMTFIVNTGRRFYNIFFKRLLLSYSNQNTKMIELGSGTSSLAFLLAPHINSYHGTDISPAIVELASEQARAAKMNNITFSLGDCRNLDDALKNKYDLAWSQGLLEHFDDPFAVLQSHIDSLKPGGVAVASVPAIYSIHHLWYALTRPKFLRKFWPWTEQIFFSRTHLEALGEKSGHPYQVFRLPPFGIGMILGIFILEVRKNK